jgi:AAA domain
LEPCLSMLLAAGWQEPHIDNNGNAHITRPAKDPREGSSATVWKHPDHHVTIWSTSVDGARRATPYYVKELGEFLEVQIPRQAESSEPDKVKADDRAHHPTSITLGELLDSDEPVHDWHVPGRFEKMDRLMLTGGEGRGKSTLLRQMAIGAAIGEDSLAEGLLRERHAPLRVLLVDAENSRSQLRREFTKQIDALGLAERSLVRVNLRVELRTGGLTLNDPKDPEGDRRWLEAELQAVRPDLLVIGPVWKLIEGDSTTEEANRPLAKWFDKMRVTYEFTLLIEAHTPHDAVRPYGWSGWKRWPEFGLHLHEDGRLEHWRGQREEREWPERLERADGPWLWKPTRSSAPTPLDRTEASIQDARYAVHRVLTMAKKKPLTKSEILDRAAKRKADVVAALARMVDDGFVVATDVERTRANGSSYTVTLYRLAGDAVPDSDPLGAGTAGTASGLPRESPDDQQEREGDAVPDEACREEGLGTASPALNGTARCGICHVAHSGPCRPEDLV